MFFVKPKQEYLLYFNDKNEKVWLPEQLWGKCIIKVTSWDNASPKSDSIIFGIKGEFSQISRIDMSKALHGWVKHDFSYMVDFMYNVLSKMGIAEHFAEHVYELINAVNDYEHPVVYYDNDDLPF